MIKNLLIHITLVALTTSSALLFFSGCATKTPVQIQESQLVYTYIKLKLLDLDQMLEIIQEKLRGYKKTSNEEMLQEALKICLSRPNGDDLIEKIIDSIRYSADTNDLWGRSVEKVTQQAITALKLETTATEDQITYLILLENLLSEFRPEFIKQYKGPKLETRIVEKIAEADITVSLLARNESRLNLMNAQRSPSSIAKTLINEKNQTLKNK